MKKLFSKFIYAIFILGIFLNTTPVLAQTGTGNPNDLQGPARQKVKEAADALIAELKNLRPDQGLTEDFIVTTERLIPVERDRVKAALTKAQLDNYNGLAQTDRVINRRKDPNDTVRAIAKEQNLTSDDSCTALLNVFAPTKWTNAVLVCLVLPTLGYVLALVGSILDVAVRISVYDFAAYANKPVFYTLWTLGRDFSNIFFIFILLNAAFQTLLGRDTGAIQKTLVPIVTVAILINFSFPISRIVIDVSNVFAVEFYNAINPKNSKGEGQLSAIVTKNLSAFQGSSLGTTIDMARISSGPAVKKTGDITTSIAALIGSVVVISVLTLTLLFAAFFFIKRTLILLMLMTLSSFAFMAQLIPRASGKYAEWWSTLINEALFAPVYLFLLYIALRAMSATEGIGTLSQESSKGLSLISIDGIGAAIFYFMLVFLLNFALSLTQEIKTQGANIAMAWAEKGRDLLINKGVGGGTKFIASNTVGRLAQAGGRAAIAPQLKTLADSKFVKTFAVNSSIGKTLQEGLEKQAKEGFGQKALTENSKAFLERFKDADTKERARVAGNTNFFTGMDEETSKQVFKGLSDQDKAALKYEVETNKDINAETKSRIEALYTKATEKPEDKAKLDRAKREVETKAKVKEIIEIITGKKEGKTELTADDEKFIPQIPKNMITTYAEVFLEDKNMQKLFPHLSAGQLTELISNGNVAGKEEAINTFISEKGSDKQKAILTNPAVRTNLNLPELPKKGKSRPGDNVLNDYLERTKNLT